MITITIHKTANGLITGFDAKNHGDSIVCAAVSILTLNTVNSIEEFTDCKASCSYDEAGGYLSFHLAANGNEDGKQLDDCRLLLASMELGLVGIKKQYGKDIDIKIREVR